MNMADRIQQMRKKAGLSQEELADRVGVSRQAVSKWEGGQSSPDLENIVIMSDLFGVTTDYLLKGIEPVVREEHQTGRTMAAGFMAACAALAGIWSFAANRFHFHECVLIILAGAAVGAGLGIAFHAAGRMFAKDRDGK